MKKLKHEAELFKAALLADSVNQNDADARFFVRRLCGRLVWQDVRGDEPLQPRQLGVPEAALRDILTERDQHLDASVANCAEQIGEPRAGFIRTGQPVMLNVRDEIHARTPAALP